MEMVLIVFMHKLEVASMFPLDCYSVQYMYIPLTCWVSFSCQCGVHASAPVGNNPMISAEGQTSTFITLSISPSTYQAIDLNVNFKIIGNLRPASEDRTVTPSHRHVLPSGVNVTVGERGCLDGRSHGELGGEGQRVSAESAACAGQRSSHHVLCSGPNHEEKVMTG